LYSDENNFGGYTIIVPNGGDYTYLLGPQGTIVQCWHLP
jgi:hypothetical protein